MADADPLPSSYVARVVSPETPIPRDGALLITSTSPDGNADPFVTVRSDSASESIDGTLVRLALMYWSWVPDEPLPLGSYLVRTQAFGGAPVVEQQVTVNDELAPDIPEISLTAIPTIMDYPDVLNCCRNEGKAVGDGQCFATTTQHMLFVHFELSSTLSAVALHQFLFRISIPGQDVASYATAADVNAYGAVAYEEQAAEYCVIVKAIDIATQAEHALPELSPLCIPHGTMGTIGYDPFEYDEADLERHNCELPPDSLVGPWCEYNHDACEPLELDELIGHGCRFYDAVCNDGEVPDPMDVQPDAGMGGVPDPMDAQPGPGMMDQGVTSPGEAGTDPEPGPVHSQPEMQTAARGTAGASGCSAALSSGAQSTVPYLLVLLVLAARRWQRLA